MSDTNGTCEYVLDPDDPETWGGEEGDECYVDEEVLNDEGVWTCPHDAEEGEDLCIFHLPLKKKDAEEVVLQFLETLDEATTWENSEIQNRQLQFVGSIFGSFETTGDLPETGVEQTQIDLTHSEINGSLDWSDSTFDIGRLRLHAIKCLDDASFESAEVGGSIEFVKSNFNGNVNFGLAEVSGDVDLSFTNISGDAYFRLAEVGENIDFAFAKISGDIDFYQAEIGGDANFGGLDIEGGRFDGVDLTDANFTGANLSGASLESTLLSRARLFGADLRGAKFAGAIIGDARIDDDTKFLGYPSEDSKSSPHTISAIRSRPKCVYDPDYEDNNEHIDVFLNADKAKSVYRMLEELSGKHARPRLQARSFVRRQDLQKQDYWNDATADDASLEERFIAGARWSRAKVARATLLYGESPWRVIAWSLGIILSFALLFPLGGWMKPEGGDPITYAQIASNPAEILNSVYYSTLTYTALGFGDFQPVGFGRLLTTVETGLGAVMLALLVFILGRRAAR